MSSKWECAYCDTLQWFGDQNLSGLHFTMIFTFQHLAIYAIVSNNIFKSQRSCHVFVFVFGHAQRAIRSMHVIIVNFYIKNDFKNTTSGFGMSVQIQLIPRYIVTNNPVHRFVCRRRSVSVLKAIHFVAYSCIKP